MITIIGILLILGIWAFITASNITRDVKLASNELDAEADKAKIEELIITETRDGEKFWEVYANSGQYDGNKKGARLTEVKGNFYKEGKVVLSFDAPEALYIEQNKEIKLTGGSRAATNEAIYITADEISWTGNKDEITATGNVKILKSKDFLIKSDKSTFNTDFTNLKVMGNSQTNVYKKN